MRAEESGRGAAQPHAAGGRLFPELTEDRVSLTQESQEVWSKYVCVCKCVYSRATRTKTGHEDIPGQRGADGRKEQPRARATAFQQLQRWRQGNSVCKVTREPQLDADPCLTCCASLRIN